MVDQIVQERGARPSVPVLLRWMEMPDPTVAILEILAHRSRASRAELVDATGVSPATVGRAIARLRREGILRESSPNDSRVGRPPRIVELEERSAFVVGVDAGGHTLRAALGDLQGAIRARIARPVRDPGDPEALIDDLAGLVRELSASLPASAVRVVAAGVSGIVDPSAGRVLLSPDLPGLGGAAIVDLLRERLGVPVVIDNDDLLAAVGEAAAGAAIGCRNVVFLSLGYGLGAGLIVDGRPIRGASNAAGAIAYFAPGRLEDRASGRAIPTRYQAAVRRKESHAAVGSRPASAHVQVGDARAVFELAAGGDAVAAGVVADTVSDLADLAVDVATLLDPDVIVVGGGLVNAGPALFRPIEARLRAALPYPPRLVPSALEDAAVLHGAVSLGLALARRSLAGLDASGRPGVAGPALALV
jgi:predicted NBD/HSP70 family sugar kinase